MELGAKSRMRRVILADHMCVLPYGHNLNLLVLFQEAMKPYFDSAVCLATSELPDEAEQSQLVDRVLRYPYDGLIPSKSGNKSSSRKESSMMYSSIGLNGRRALYTASNVFFNYDYVRARTARDWKKIFRTYSITYDDVLFFPSTEYYGCVSLIDFLLSIPKENRPAVHFRMIGVMESAKYALGSGRPEFISTIRRGLKNSLRLSLSAEVPVYCEFLERLIGAPVTYLPYPLGNESSPLNWQAVKVLCSPGQGRYDKGFHRLYSIITAIRKMGTINNFVFDIQNMRQSDRFYRARYESILAHVPNLTLRPARMKQQEIDQAYRNADMLVLPYDSDTYELRGSAVYQEGLAIGRPVVCSTGLGFSDLVTRYGNGLLASDDNEFAEKIVELAAVSKEEIEKRVKQARLAYEQDFKSGLNAVLESISQ